MRSFWGEIEEMEREYNAVVTVTMYATNQRGVFTVRMSALQLGVLVNDEPLSFSVTKRLPDGGSLPFTGALWDCSRKLNDMVSESQQQRLAAQ